MAWTLSLFFSLILRMQDTAHTHRHTSGLPDERILSYLLYVRSLYTYVQLNYPLFHEYFFFDFVTFLEQNFVTTYVRFFIIIGILLEFTKCELLEYIYLIDHLAFTHRTVSSGHGCSIYKCYWRLRFFTSMSPLKF